VYEPLIAPPFLLQHWTSMFWQMN